MFVVKGMDKELLRQIQVLRVIFDLEHTSNHLANASVALGITHSTAAHARDQLWLGGYLEWQTTDARRHIAITDRGRWLLDEAKRDPWITT